jgi:hypothetical protein
VSLTSGSAGSYTGRCHNSEKDRLMSWLIIFACGIIFMTCIVINTEESTPIPPQRNDDGTWFTTGHYRFGLLKGKELELQREQMN